MNTLFLHSLLTEGNLLNKIRRLSWTEVTWARRLLDKVFEVVHLRTVGKAVENRVVQLTALSFFCNRLVHGSSKRCRISTGDAHDGIFSKEAAIGKLSFIDGVDSDNIARLHIIVKGTFPLSLPDLSFGQRCLKRIWKN